MTTINRTVTRRTRETVFERGHRRIMVMLMPGDIIGFRAERTRRIYTARIADVYQAVQAWEVARQRREVERIANTLVKSGVPKRTARAQARKEVALRNG